VEYDSEGPHVTYFAIEPKSEARKAKPEDKNSDIISSIANSELTSRLRQCLINLEIRKSSEENKEEEKIYSTWSVKIGVSLDQKSGIIEDVDLTPGSEWPLYFDEEVRTCYINEIKRTEVKLSAERAERKYVEITYPLCYNPRSIDEFVQLSTSDGIFYSMPQ
jgi:hypothetical protein